MRAFLIGDCHLADKSPSIRTETYAQDILAKIAWCSEEAKRQGCDVLIQNGDVFHIKAAIRNSHWLVQAAHEAFTAGGLPVLIVPGNHDLMYDRLETIPSQPLGSLAKMSGIDLLVGPHLEFPVFGIPYLPNWGELPRWMNWYKFWALTQIEEPLVVTHAPVFPNHITPPYDFISAGDWSSQQEFGSMNAGHIHDQHGVYKEENIWITNMGALSRGSLHESSLNRKPKALIFETPQSDEWLDSLKTAGIAGFGQVAKTQTGTEFLPTLENLTEFLGSSWASLSEDLWQKDYMPAITAILPLVSDPSIFMKVLKRKTIKTNSNATDLLGLNEIPVLADIYTPKSLSTGVQTETKSGESVVSAVPKQAAEQKRVGPFEIVDVPHKPAEEVFRLDEHTQEVVKKAKLATFLDSLGSGTIEATTVEMVIADIDKMDLSVATKAAARELVENAYARL